MNNSLKRKGVNKRIKLGRRYGYKALDLYDAKGGMLKTLRSGMSSGEAKEYLYAMQTGVDVYRKPKPRKKKK